MGSPSCILEILGKSWLNARLGSKPGDALLSRFQSSRNVDNGPSLLHNARPLFISTEAAKVSP